jgi:nucleoid-associated protein YgaU
MTSDAKIGLLLGLVFIFIIAFVINGLPRFKSIADNSQQTTNIVNPSNELLGIASRERQAPGVFGVPGQPNVVEPPSHAPAQDATASNDIPGDLRYNMTLPLQLPAGQGLQESPPTTDGLNPTAPLAPAINEQTQAKEKQHAPAASVQNKTYTVLDGDNLSTIAVKVYGPQEGKRLINVNRIFEANRNQLKTPNDIAVGQKLIIPPLPAAASTQKTNDTLSGPMFEKVGSIGKTADTGRWYVVKENDNLWKIATEQLGTGNRYTEILKLNADLLVNENKLETGMRLRLPAK